MCVKKESARRHKRRSCFFLEAYQHVDFLPTVLFKEARNEYMIYTFLAGTCNDPQREKQEMLRTLVREVVNHLRPVPSWGWGWSESLANSWGAFLDQERIAAKRTLMSFLSEEDHLLVAQLIERIKEHPSHYQPYMLHGDCGVHNFLFREGKLSGVIDPTPLVGEPLYDLLYAFCSSPEDLSEAILMEVVDELTVGSSFTKMSIIEHSIIVLYLRMSSCVQHHPHDLEAYLQAWSHWKSKL